ncbi:MAG: hypothetical protein R8L53_06790 [Mariprofundales bacterium]
MPKSWMAIIEYCVVTEMFIAYVPGLCGAHAQAKSEKDVRSGIQQVVDLLYANNTLVNNSDIRGHMAITQTEERTDNE